MKAQGFQPHSQSVALMSSLPEGRRMAWVTLGEFSEPDAYDTSLWTDEDYQTHWRETARACLDGKLPAVFCMNYSEDGCTCLPVWRSGDDFVAKQFALVPLSDLALSGHRLSLADFSHEPDSNASQWDVTREEMAAITLG